MHLIERTEPSVERAPGHLLVMCLTIGVLLTFFYVIEHFNTEVSSLHAFTMTADEMADRAADGDATRRFAIPLLAGFGVLLLLRKDGYRIGLHSTLGWFLCGYLAWCVLSVIWSIDQALTIRRVMVLIFCSIGALGIARQMTLRDLCVITLVITTVFVAYDLFTELSRGTFAPFASAYRFAGTLHPNAQAPNCATMALAAGCLATRARRGRFFLWTLAAIGVVLLILTKSRTVYGAFLAGLLVYNLLGASWSKKVLVIATLLWVALTIAWACVALDLDLERKIVNAAMVGREDESESLSGRLPLWEAMIPYFFDRPLLGHGYQTFWIPKRIEKFSYTFQYTVPDGHSAYLDAALDLGVVGAMFCLVTVFTGVREAGRRYKMTADIGYGFLFALFACRSLNALLESNFAVPTSFVPFMMMCGLAHLGACREPGLLPFAEVPVDEVDE